MVKEEIYSQIDKFNISIINSKETKNNKYYYINSDEALLKSQFIDKIQNDVVIKAKLDSISIVMDLSFGSGNLTSHILLENQIQYKNIILNDYFLDDCNQELENLLENCQLKQCNFFNSDCFEENSVDLLIFNPTHGGKPTKKDFISKENKDFDALNKTLSKILKPNSIVIFRGYREDFQELIFSNFKYKNVYLDGSQSLYVCYDIDVEKKICYEYLDNQFIENENCEIEKGFEDEDLDIGELIQELEENKIENNFGEVLKSEVSIITDSLINYKEKFTSWWLSSNYNSTDEKPFTTSTKKSYLRALEKLNSDLTKFGFDNIDIFKIQDLKEVNELLNRLELGDLYTYNKRNNSTDTSNGLKQYIKFLEYENKINAFNNDKEEDKNITNIEIVKIRFSNEPKGNLNFEYKNILLKGVPGTGKSETIKNIITDKLNMKELADNVLRINIHSASSNSDLMQGISISTTKDNENVLYREKQGAILNHIFKAIYKPKQPFVLVLEEIQENSLNELIGDLIYLIEDKKRTIVDLDIPNNTEIVYDELFDKINEKSKENNKSLDYVELPSLVENSQNNTKMIVPDNLFIFCTSNYRDDKKVIEDNLLRRFDVIEIYPKYDGIYKSEDIPKFLEKLNDEILKQFKDEIHPDRYLIGHANWLDIKEEDNEDNLVLFYKALLKVIIEFKEIREIDFDSEVKPILENVFKDIKSISNRLEQYLKIFYNDDKLGLKSYKNIVDILQKKIYKSFL